MFYKQVKAEFQTEGYHLKFSQKDNIARRFRHITSFGWISNETSNVIYYDTSPESILDQKASMGLIQYHMK